MSGQQADPLYVEARRTLLDALDALEEHLPSIILVGAQAVYLRTESSSLAVAPFTTDSDLAVDPETIGSAPAIDELMTAAGFRPGDVGTWTKDAMVEGRSVGMVVDVMVPAAVAPGDGRRSVELEGHNRKATRRTAGLEAALVDWDPLLVTSLQGDDPRSHQIRVAGPGALLVAKLHKISERVAGAKADRISDKDATDIYRMFQVVPAGEMGRRLSHSSADERSASVTTEALALLDDLFGRRGDLGIQMVERSLGTSGPDIATVTNLCTAYVGQVRASTLSKSGDGEQADDPDPPSILRSLWP